MAELEGGVGGMGSFGLGGGGFQAGGGGTPLTLRQQTPKPLGW